VLGGGIGYWWYKKNQNRENSKEFINAYNEVKDAPTPTPQG